MLTLFLYGNSLALSSLGASLRGQPDLLVIPLDPVLSPSPADADAVDGDIVVFDMAVTTPDLLAFWRMSPDMLLIGVDMASDTALVLSTATQPVLTTNDLLQVIRTHASFSPRPVRRCPHCEAAAGDQRRYH